MAHRVSAPALVAAREVLKRYHLETRGLVNGMTCSEAHVAIVIDHATGVYKVALLRPEVRYWQTALRQRSVEAAQLVNFLNKFVEVFAEVPHYSPKEQPGVAAWEYPVDFGPSAPRLIPLSKSALEAARYLLHYYLFAPEADRIHLAQAVELGMGLDRAFEALPLAKFYLERLKAGQADNQEVVRCFRKLGILLEYLPNYADRREETLLLT